MNVKIFAFTLALIILNLWGVAFSQSGLQRYTLVLQLTDDYELAENLAKKASEVLDLELKLGNITYSTQYGRITSDACSSVLNCSDVERFEPAEYISLGNSKDYHIKGPEQIAIIAGLYQGPNSADYALRRVKPFYRDAFIQVDTVYPLE